MKLYLFFSSKQSQKPHWYSYRKHLASASPAEVKLAKETLESVNVPLSGRGRPKKRPLRLINGKGYASDPRRKRLKALKIDLNRFWNGF